jgi:PAS domain S-box-containing protein
MFGEGSARQRAVQEANEALEARAGQRTAALQGANTPLGAIATRDRAEALFRSVVECAPDALVILDGDGRIALVNAQAEALFGWPRQALLGQPLTALVPAWPAGELGGGLERATAEASGQVAAGVETYGRRRDGTAVPIEIKRSPVETSAGVLVIYAIRDITERQRPEAAWAAEARFLRTQAAVAEIALSSLRHEALAGPLLETIGRAQGYAYGGLWRVAEGGSTAILVASYGAGIEAFIGVRQPLHEGNSFVAQVIRTGQAAISSVHIPPVGCHPPTRAIKARAVLGLPLVARTGRVLGCMVFADPDDPDRFTARDLSQGTVLASQVAHALENSELFSQVQRLQEQYRIVTDALNDAVFTLDTQGRFTFGNAAGERLTGYRPEELLGHTFAELVAPDDLPRLLDRFRRALAGEPIAPQVELELIRKDGGRVPIELSMANLILDGRIVGRVGVARDIAERRRAEAQIKASLQEKEVLLRELHHRVKNNLQIIASLLNLQSRYIDDPNILQLFVESRNRVQSMALIHENLYQSQNISNVDFAEYIKHLTTQLLHSYELNTKKIKLSIHAKDIFLDVNTAIPCGLIINELVSNALKHAFPDRHEGEISIAVSRDHRGRIQLVARDNGVGLPADIDLATTKTLGLKLVAALVNQLSASLEVDHADGTRFRLTFTPQQLRREARRS